MEWQTLVVAMGPALITGIGMYLIQRLAYKDNSKRANQSRFDHQMEHFLELSLYFMDKYKEYASLYAHNITHIHKNEPLEVTDSTLSELLICCAKMRILSLPFHDDAHKLVNTVHEYNQILVMAQKNPQKKHKGVPRTSQDDTIQECGRCLKTFEQSCSDFFQNYLISSTTPTAPPFLP